MHAWASKVLCIVEWHYGLDLTTVPNCPDPCMYSCRWWVGVAGLAARGQTERPWGNCCASILLFSVFGGMAACWDGAGPHMELAAHESTVLTVQTCMGQKNFFGSCFMPHAHGFASESLVSWYGMVLYCLLSISHSWRQCLSPFRESARYLIQSWFAMCCESLEYFFNFKRTFFFIST